MPRTTNTEQRTLHFAGQVQGVCFRATTRTIASNLAVTGFVQNLSDGQVKLVAEGTAAELDAFEQAIVQELGQHISGTTRDIRPATQQYDAFNIQY